jgi:hypothetical protein
LSGGASFDKKEFKRNVAGSGDYAPLFMVAELILSSEEPHLDLTKTQLLFMSIRQHFFISPLNISVSTCPHYPHDEDLNIWEGSGSN